MRAVHIHIFLIALFICAGRALAFQANTPEGALEEMATTDKLEGLTKHFPLKVQEAIDKLGAKEKEQIAEKLLVRNLMASEGITFRKSDDGSAWEVINAKHELEGSIRVKNSFISGTEAIVVLEATDSRGPNLDAESAQYDMKRRRQRLLVSMQLQEGEWRLIEFGPWQSKNLEDILRREGQATGESAAETTLHLLNTLLAAYRATYPEIGFPESLQALSGPEGAEASSEHAMLLDPSFMTASLIKDGYRFQYTLVDPGTGKDHVGHYRITATPVEFSKNSGRSLFTNETQVIRATKDQRDADENDEPLGAQHDDN